MKLFINHERAEKNYNCSICCSCFSSLNRLFSIDVRESRWTYFLLPLHSYVQWPYSRHFWHRTLSADGFLWEKQQLSCNIKQTLKQNSQNLQSRIIRITYSCFFFHILHQISHKTMSDFSGENIRCIKWQLLLNYVHIFSIYLCIVSIFKVLPSFDRLNNGYQQICTLKLNFCT